MEERGLFGNQVIKIIVEHWLFQKYQFPLASHTVMAKPSDIKVTPVGQSFVSNICALVFFLCG